MSGTDWEAYYQKKSVVSVVTQHILFSKVARILSRVCTATYPEVCELGGGLTAFPKFLGRNASVDFGRYVAIDTCEKALELGAREYYSDDRISFVKGNVTNDLHRRYGEFDVVLSFGLIEHFEREHQIHIVAEHLRLLRKNGIAIISFPTGTFQYRFVRAVMEFCNIWAFHDEVPLSLEEFHSLRPSSNVVYSKVLRRLPLTQMVVVLHRPDFENAH